MIILDEKKYAENLIKDGFIKFMSLRDLTILAKYYHYWKGLKPSLIENNLVEFCKKYNPDYNEVKNDWRIRKAISTAKREGFKVFNPVIITENEIKKIRTIENDKYQRLLFVMLAIAKISKYSVVSASKNKYKSEDLIGYFYNYNIREAIKLAKTVIRKNDTGQTIYDLVNLKMVEVTKYSTYRICFADDASKPFVVIDSCDDIISFFPHFCEVCGKPIVKKNNRQKMCEICFQENRKKYQKEIMRNKQGYYDRNISN